MFVSNVKAFSLFDPPFFIWEGAEDYLPTSDVHVLSHSVMSDSDSMDLA